MSAAGPRRALGTALGLGRIPFAPGTWGSLGAVGLAVLLFGIEGWNEGLWLVAATPGGALSVAVVPLALLALGIWIGSYAGQDYGRGDPPAFVLDEVVGQAIALAPLVPGPMEGWRVLAAFAFFRLFDIAKPPPVRQSETLPGGVGIMADDVVAGVLAAACVWGLPFLIA